MSENKTVHTMEFCPYVPINIPNHTGLPFKVTVTFPGGESVTTICDVGATVNIQPTDKAPEITVDFGTETNLFRKEA